MQTLSIISAGFIQSDSANGFIEILSSIGSIQIPNISCLIGNNELEAFIYAKEYTVGVGGTGVLRGTIWADAWSTKAGCGSNTANIVVEQTARWSDLGLQPKNTPPLLRNISSWQRKQR